MTSSRSPQIPHVAILIETSRSYGRGLLRGIRRYLSLYGPWSVFVELRALESAPPPWLRNWRGDGILTRTGSQRMANTIRKVGVPTVELRATRLRHDFPFIGVDNEALGRMVAEHLLERGFRHFALYDLDTEDYFEARRESFIATIAKAGYAVNVLRAAGHRERPADWERHQERIVRWLRDLPKPLGLLACTDQLGFWLLDACHRGGIKVPEDIAVVGVEDDETLCLVSRPPMSSVKFNAEGIGFEAARLLDAMMSGSPAPPSPMLIPPLGITVRQSSDVVAIDDNDLAEALRYIRQHACDDIVVADVLRAVPLSRSTLERKIRAALGRSLHAEILRVKLERAKSLLSDTELTLDGVARRSGFRYPQLLCERFKRAFGQTPGAYRASMRGDQIAEDFSANRE